MTEQAVSDWMIANLPPESGPIMLSMIGNNWDATRPGLIVLFVGYLLLQGFVVYAVWRFLTR